MSDISEIKDRYEDALRAREARIHDLVAERDRLREALQKIAEQVRTCVGYYKCNGCESRIAQMAEAALLERGTDA